MPRASADREAGVVFRMEWSLRKTTPAASFSVASHHLISDAATPPCGDARRGVRSSAISGSLCFPQAFGILAEIRIPELGHAVTKELDAFSCLVTPSPKSWTRSPAWSRRHQRVGRVLLFGHSNILLMSCTEGGIFTHREFKWGLSRGLLQVRNARCCGTST